MQSEYTNRCRKATGIISLNSFKGSKLWKLDGDKLQNKAFPHTLLRRGMTMWDCFDKWNFKTKDDLIYIENSSERKVLEVLRYGSVILKNFKEDKPEQLWKKGEPNAEGYFTLENYKVPKVLTAIASVGQGPAESLEVKGNINLN